MESKNKQINQLTAINDELNNKVNQFVNNEPIEEKEYTEEETEEDMLKNINDFNKNPEEHIKTNISLDR